MNKKCGYIQRYGKFDIIDNIGVFLFTPFLLMMMCMLWILDGFSFLIAMNLMIILSLLLYTFAPYFECFLYYSDRIKIKKFWKTDSILLSKEITIIVSRASISNRYVRYGEHILRNKIAISIIEKENIDDTVKALHTKLINPVRNKNCYTNNTVEQIMYNRYIYSFVCDQVLFEHILNNSTGPVIIPESLKGKVIVPDTSREVYIDIGW